MLFYCIYFLSFMLYDYQLGHCQAGFKIYIKKAYWQ